MPYGNPWEQWLLDLLCRIYKANGGDCADLANKPLDQVIDFVRKSLGGTRPSFPTPADEEEFDAVLTALSAHLNLSDNTLTAKSQGQLEAMIASLWKTQ